MASDSSVSGSGASAQGDGARAVGERGVGVGGDNSGIINTGTQVIITYLQQGGQQRDPEQLSRQVESYLRWVIARYGKIELRGIERGGRKVLTLDLDQAYVGLEASVSAPREERGALLGLLDKLRGGLHTTREYGLLEDAQAVKADIDLDDVLKLGNHLVVTGGPGCGKTTVMLHMAWALARAILDGSDVAKDRLGLETPLPLPIFIPLAAYARYRRDSRRRGDTDARARMLASFISEYLIERQADFDLPKDFFQQLLRDGRDVLLLLDGLDEVANEDERAAVREAVEELAAGRDAMRLIVTCRIAAYRGRTALGGNFREVAVTPLDDERIRGMVRRFYDCIYSGMPSQVDAKTGELMHGLTELEEQRRRRLGDQAPRLIDSPLMVRLLLIVHYNERRMPEQRAELFMKATESMLQLEYLPDEQVQQELKYLVGEDWTDHYQMAQHLAFHMHEQGTEQGREVDEETLRHILRDSGYDQYTDQLVEVTQNRGGLLEERMGTFRFIHLGFQEYLAARYIAEVIRSDGGVEAMARFLERGPIVDSWWREVALLIPGYCVANSNARLARDFLRRLAGVTRKADAPPLGSDMHLAAAEIAASAAVELRERDARLFAELAQRLVSLLEDKPVMLISQPKLRVAAGVALAGLDDPREGVMRVDAMPLCLVPAGPFCLGSDKSDDMAWDDERPFESCFNLPYQYAIGQHPVTQAQFNAFVADEGYTNPGWWSVARAAGVWTDGKVRRRVFFWEDEAHGKRGERFEEADAPRDFGAPFNLPNHPVVGVTWYEALAFTEWLTARWRAQGWLTPRQSVRLPNEPEWEKAARGGLQIPREPMIQRVAYLAGVPKLVSMANPTPKAALPVG